MAETEHAAETESKAEADSDVTMGSDNANEDVSEEVDSELE